MYLEWLFEDNFALKLYTLCNDEIVEVYVEYYVHFMHIISKLGLQINSNKQIRKTIRTNKYFLKSKLEVETSHNKNNIALQIYYLSFAVP